MRGEAFVGGVSIVPADYPVIWASAVARKCSRVSQVAA